MTLDDVKDIETLRRAAKILEAEVQTLSKLVLSLKRELHEAKHGKPEQLKLSPQIQELEDQLARRNKLLFGDSSEKSADRISQRRAAKRNNPATDAASSLRSKLSSKCMSRTSKTRRASYAAVTSMPPPDSSKSPKRSTSSNDVSC